MFSVQSTIVFVPNIYIYVIHRQIVNVVSQLFSVARHVGRLKLGSKSAQLYVRLSIRALGQQAYHVGKGIIRYYVVTAAAVLSPECSAPMGERIYIYIYIYIYITICLQIVMEVFFV